MKRCRHCGQKTLATLDGACPWCGYPLFSAKRLEKTYSEIIAERRNVAARPVYDIKEEWAVPEPESDATGGNARQEDKPGPDIHATSEPILVTQDEEEYLDRNQAIPEPPQAAASSMEEGTGIKEAADPIEVEKEAPNKNVPVETAPTAEEDTASPEEGPGLVEEGAGEMSMEEAMDSIPSIIPEIPIDITVEDLLAAYQADDREADARFNNQLVRLAGVVAMVNIKDQRDFQYIILSGKDQNIFQSIKCVFNQQSAGGLQELEKGTAVTVLGRFKGSLTAMNVVDCRVE